MTSGFLQFPMLLRSVQPPEMWRHIDRFVYALTVVVAGVVLLVFLQGFGVSL